MKKNSKTKARLILLFAFCLTVKPGISQKTLPALGEFDISELQMKSCAFDPSASAMYLLKTQETEIEEFSNGNHEIRFRLRGRIKIFSTDGLSLANMHFVFQDNDDTDLGEVTAFVGSIDTDGNKKVQKLSRKDIYREKIQKGIKSISFAIPNVTVGSVIEYSFQIKDRASYFLPSWNFQEDIPIELAFCRVLTPEYSSMSHRIVSDLPVETVSSIIQDRWGKASNSATYTVSKVPAFKAEPFMGALTNNHKRVEFSFSLRSIQFQGQTIKRSWKSVNEYYNASIDMQISGVIDGTQGLISDAKKIGNTTERVNYIIDELNKTIKWNGVKSKYSKFLSQVWAQKEGNTTELNMLLLNLLKNAEVRCFPLMVSSREHGKIDTSFASAGQFDGMDIVIVEKERNYVVDANQKNISHEIIPFNVVNTLAFLIDGDQGTWVMLSDDQPYFREGLVAFSRVDSSGAIVGSATHEYYDYAKDVALRLAEEKKENVKDEDKKEPEESIVIQNLKREEPKQLNLPLIETFDFKYEPQSTGDYFFINPAFMADFRKNPFTSEQRNFDIDFDCQRSFVISLKIELPKGFEVSQIPKSISLVKSDSTIIFRRFVAQEGEFIQCLIQLQYLSPYFSKEEYADLREFFKRMYGLLNETIVLKRKKA